MNMGQARALLGGHACSDVHCVTLHHGGTGMHAPSSSSRSGIAATASRGSSACVDSTSPSPVYLCVHAKNHDRKQQTHQMTATKTVTTGTITTATTTATWGGGTTRGRRSCTSGLVHAQTPASATHSNRAGGCEGMSGDGIGGGWVRGCRWREPARTGSPRWRRRGHAGQPGPQTHSRRRLAHWKARKSHPLQDKGGRGVYGV
jgi:hypothetical protein